jgi:hypothetical protein
LFGNKARLWTREKESLGLYVKSQHSPVPAKFVDLLLRHYAINPSLSGVEQMVLVYFMANTFNNTQNSAAAFSALQDISSL